ncbi:hypothetical protein LJC27_05115 [Christensenellaceae bacterium OttesenSCG-928-M15]|nr:hypothetical protein [Christensenellaceae bacterium OttesenSCG-928-M15]
MKIKANGTVFEGAPQEIVEQLRKLLLSPAEAPDAAGYVQHIQGIYETVTGEKMLLEGGLDQQIEDMFLYLEYIGILEVLEDE